MILVELNDNVPSRALWISCSFWHYLASFNIQLLNGNVEMKSIKILSFWRAVELIMRVNDDFGCILKVYDSSILMLLIVLEVYKLIDGLSSPERF